MFVLEEGSRSPLFRQIQDQVRYAVSVGTLAPGDALPSIRQLESELGVNRNTVRRAYTELAAEGLIVMRRGCEARVAALRTEPAEDVHRRAGDLADEFLRRAEAEGLDSIAFARLVARRARDHDARHPRWCVVECSLRQARAFADAVEQHLQRSVVAIELEALQALHAPGDAPGDAATSLAPSIRHVLTPPWHVAEASAALEGRTVEVHPMTVGLSESCVAAAHEHVASARVGLVVRDQHSGPGYRKIVRESLDIDVPWTSAEDESSVQSLVDQCDVLIYTTPCDELVRRVVPTTVEAIELVFEPNPHVILDLVNEYSPQLPEGGNES